MDKAGSKRAREAAAGPAGKRPAGAWARDEHREDTRDAVAALYRHYNALLADPSNAAAFEGLLQAPAGSPVARLAARLVPRFLERFPQQVAAAADVLTQLPLQQHSSDARLKSLEDATRQEALHGLLAVLRAAPACAATREAAVTCVLAFLLRLLPLAGNDDSDEPEAEEGELSAPDASPASGRWIRHMLGTALQAHPAITLAYCFGRLAAAAGPAGSRGSSQSTAAAGDQQQLRGVRIWLGEQLLGEAVPAREKPRTSSRPERAERPEQSSCRLQSVLDASPELQAWVVSQAAQAGQAPAEVRSLLQSVLQLLPARQQAAAAKLQQEAAAQAAADAQGVRQPQPQRPDQQGSRRAGAGSFPPPPDTSGGQLPPGRSWSLPTVDDKQRSELLRTPHAEAGRFPSPPGPICRVEPCLLVSQLPPDVTAAAVASALGAEEAWLLERPPWPGSSGGGCACASYKGVLEAAKAYLRHNGTARFGREHPPVLLAFADAMPSCSRRAAAVAAEPSAYVWASKAAAGDAESITEELREAGCQLSHVHRVNNAAAPGTLLQTPSAQQAAAVAAYLLKQHPAAAAAAAAGAAAGAQQQQQQPVREPPPPLPSDPPPPSLDAWLAGSRTGLQRRASAVLAPSPARAAHASQPPHNHPQAAAAAGQGDGVAARGAADGDLRRTSSLPAAVGSWRAGPPSPALPQGFRAAAEQQQGRQLQQPAGPRNIPPPAPPPGPPPPQAWPDAAAAAAAAARQGWRAAGHAASPHHPQLTPQSFQVQQQAAALHGLQQRRLGQAAMQPVVSPPPAGHQPRQGAAAAAAGGGSAVAAVQPAVPPAAPAGPGSAVLWQGCLVKQQVRVCGVAALDLRGGPGPCSQALGSAPEPQGWPGQLHVNHRISVSEALDQYAAAPPNQRAVRWLVPLDPARGDAQKLQQFIHYLNEKKRAGMVKLPGSREGGVGSRSLYLIVPTAVVCQQLQLAAPQQQQDAALIAVVVSQL